MTMIVRNDTSIHILNVADESRFSTQNTVTINIDHRDNGMLQILVPKLTIESKCINLGGWD